MKTLFSLLLPVIFIHAGDLDRVDTSLLFVQGMHIDSYQSLGFSNMFTSSAIDIASGNPASLINFSEVSIGLNLNYASKIDNALFSDVGIKKPDQLFPGSIAIIVPIEQFCFGISYHRKYANILDFGKIPITTVADPTGEFENFFEPTFKTKINSISGMIAKGMDDFFVTGDHLSFGLQIFLDMYLRTEKIDRAKATVEENDINWKVGANYHLNDIIQFGFLYEKSLDVAGNIKYSGSLLTGEPDTSQFVDYVNTGETTIKVHAQLPDKMVFGAQINPTEYFSLSTTLSYVFWEALSKYYKNNLDASFSAIYSLFDFMDISGGLYQTDLRRKNSIMSDNRATFLSAGLKFELSDLTAQLVILDSHLSSGKSREQTIVNLGLGYSFH